MPATLTSPKATSRFSLEYEIAGDTIAAASLIGAGEFSAAASVLRRASATLSGSASLSGSSRVNREVSAALAGVGSLSAIAEVLNESTAATFEGAAFLSVSASALRNVAATLAGSAALSASAIVLQDVSASMQAAGSMGASASVSRLATAAFAGSASMSAAALPLILSLSIDPTGLELTAIYDGSVADAEAITLTETNGNTAPTATYATGEGTDTIVYDLSRAALAPASEVFTATGATFTDQPVDNDSLATQLDLVASANRLFAWDFTDAASLTLDVADIDAVADYWGLINGAATLGAEPQYDADAGAVLAGAERIVAASGFSANLGADGYWLAISFAETGSNTGTRVLVGDSGSVSPWFRSTTFTTGTAALGQDSSNQRRHAPTATGATVGGWRTLLMKIAMTGDARTAPVGAIAPLAFSTSNLGSPSPGAITVSLIMGTSAASTFGWHGSVRRIGTIKGAASAADLLAFARWASGGGHIVGPALPMLADSAAALTCGAQIGSPTVYWFTVYKASDFPEWPTAKAYFAIWGTDHDAGSGSIRWGDMDLLDLSDFTEQATLYNAYQGETPWLLRVPEDPDGRVLYLFYHTNGTDPRNSTRQLTHLRTSADGATWTDVADPLNINFAGGEDHTGYFNPVRLGSGDYVGWHQAEAGGDGYRAFSRATDPRDWTRQGPFDDEAIMPAGHSSSGPRRLSSGDWGISLFAATGSSGGNQSRGLAAIRVSGEERALSRFGQQINTWAVTDATTYTEGGTIYVYHVKTQTTVHVSTYAVADLPA